MFVPLPTSNLCRTFVPLATSRRGTRLWWTLTKAGVHGSESVRYTNADCQHGALPACGARHAVGRHARSTRLGGDERQESMPPLYEAQERQVQGPKTAERQRLSRRDVSEWDVRSGSERRTDTDLS